MISTIGTNELTAMLNAAVEKIRDTHEELSRLDAAIGDGLHYLTEPNYVHRFYVDHSPALSEVYLSSGGITSWHTVLIGGLRSGGRGLFALNVTDPGLFSNESNADNINQTARQSVCCGQL